MSKIFPNLSIVDLNKISKKSNVYNWQELPVNEYLTFKETLIHSELGGGVCGLYNLGSGRLNLAGFLSGNSIIISQTTRIGLMPTNWVVPQYITDTINNLFTKKNTSQPPQEYVFHLASDWDWNFQHFLTEYFPRLLWLSENIDNFSNVLITVVDEPFIFEILNVCFPNFKFLKLKRNETIEIMTACYFVSPLFKNLGHHTSYSEHAMRFLRKSYLSAWLSSTYPNIKAQKRKVFFGRKNLPNYAGNKRILTNEEELLSIATRHGFEKAYFDEMSNFEKMDLLSNIDYAIMPIGANVMNLLFAPSEIRVGIIMHPVFKPFEWFKHTLATSGAPVVELLKFSDVNISKEFMTEEQAPYEADPKIFEAFVIDLLAK